MLGISRFAITVLSAVSSGAELHHAALDAMQGGRWDTADLLFGAALTRYRREIEVEAIARLRVHQLMARVWSGREPSLEAERSLEVERRLCQIDEIETLRAPFERVDARTLLGSWRLDAPGDVAHDAETPPFGYARAA